MKKCSKRGCKSKSHAKGLCPKHSSQEWRDKNPMRAAYINWKANAKRRGKEFTISFEEFEEFAVRTDYMAGKGRTAESWHIDRIDESLGYVPGNIQKLSNTDNVRKSLQYRMGSQGKPEDFTVTTHKPAAEIDGCPF